MITDGGPHPADKWSAMTASHVCSMVRVNQNSESAAAKAARRALPRFELELADALESHHANFQRDERSRLESGSERLNQPYVAHADLDAQVAAVVEVARKTPFAEHFAKPEVQAAVRDVIQNHVASAQHVERKWHCDRQVAAGRSNKHVEAFLARHTPPVLAE